MSAAQATAEAVLEANSRHPRMRAQKEKPARSNVFIEVSIGDNDPQRMTIEVGKLCRAAMYIKLMNDRVQLYDDIVPKQQVCIIAFIPV